ncbi:PQQ-dependent sugar dehydrogenase [Kineobactrum sediminis]|nr:PQQ-dependent sugar dehydrogenase [Kineobactrum sediminis]
MAQPSSRLKLLIGVFAGIAIGATLVATLQPASDGSATRESLPELIETPDRSPGKKKESRAPGQPEPYYGELPSLAAVNIRDAVLEVVTKGLDYPWAMEFISETELLITEFSGSLQRVNVEKGTRHRITGLPDITHGKGQLGLMDLALHPDFSENGLVYFSHAVSSPDHDDRYATGLTRGRLEGDTLREVKLLLVAEPYTKSGSNLGGALEFDAAGYLYVAIGDRSINFRAQETDSLHGKILRLTADGEIPADNPFVDDPAVDDRIYALGVRNTQGLVFDAITNLMFQSEHGPMGGDEVNIIEAGKNYGWPVITYGANYTTEKIGLGTAHEGMEQPLYYYLPSIAASPLTIYRGNMFPEWEGHLLVGALRGAHVSKLALVEGQIRSERAILQEAKGRIRDLKTGPDGSLYILVQNGGRLLRLHRAPEQEDLDAPKERQGVTVYRQLCSSCHSSGQKDLVPQINDPAAWENRLAQGSEALYKNTIDGIGDMPPKGLCDNCTDAEIRAAVDFMVKRLRNQG